jgi:glycerol kinase
MGAAYLAGLQHGIYKSIDDLKELWKTDCVFEPSSKNKKVTEDYDRWIEIIKKEIK